MTQDAAARLEEMARKIRVCTACGLHKGRTVGVPGDGPASAEVLFIGEAPGFYEDKQGRPFVGQAGKFLQELLGSIGWKREEVFVTNTVKCRPPNNRDPLPDEMDTCQRLWLNNQIEAINPKLIVTLGRFSLTRLFPQMTISRARGRILEKDGITVYPVYHPAAALHQQRLREVIEDDFKRLPEVLEQARTKANAQADAGAERRQAAEQQETPRKDPPPEGPQQLSFF
jgi:DNA polymerase